MLVTSDLDEGRLFQVSEKPVTIGTGDNCDIRLPASEGIAEEHARLWWRDGRLMLHHIAPDLVTFVGSRKSSGLHWRMGMRPLSHLTSSASAWERRKPRRGKSPLPWNIR